MKWKTTNEIPEPFEDCLCKIERQGGTVFEILRYANYSHKSTVMEFLRRTERPSEDLRRYDNGFVWYLERLKEGETVTAWKSVRDIIAEEVRKG